MISPLDIAVQNQGGWAPKNRFILYRGFPLWLGSTGEGCDSIQVSGCQTRAWRSAFYTRASLVHMVLGVLILYWFPFYARLEARLGVQSLYYAKIHPKIKPLFLFFHCEAWGSWFYTDVYYTYIEYYRIIYNILIYVFNLLEIVGILWILFGICWIFIQRTT